VDTSRLEAFSDAVFAIAITLLVLAIGVPSSSVPLGPALLGLWPSYLAYAVSFIVIGAIWINHHAMFRHIVRSDDTLLLLNTLDLMFVAFLPFPTAVLAQAFHDATGEPTAAAFYGAVLFMIGLFVVATWHYASHARLLDPVLSSAQAKRIGRRYLVGPGGYAVGTVVALVLPWVALVLYLALNVFFLWPRRPQPAQ
jgi:uncharacterized membrane protein